MPSNDVSWKMRTSAASKLHVTIEHLRDYIAQIGRVNGALLQRPKNAESLLNEAAKERTAVLSAIEEAKDGVAGLNEVLTADCESEALDLLIKASREIEPWCTFQYSLKLLPEPLQRHQGALTLIVDGLERTAERIRLSRLRQNKTADAIALNQTSSFTPIEPDINILQALAKRSIRVGGTKLHVAGVGQRTITTRLPILEKAGMVDRGAGKRSGWAITDSGRMLLEGFRAC